MTINPDDTLQSCLNRILQSGDVKEPLAQFLVEVLMRFGGAGGPAGPQGDPGPTGPAGADGAPGPNPIITAADQAAIKALPTQHQIFAQSDADGTMYFTSNNAWVQINTTPIP